MLRGMKFGSFQDMAGYIRQDKVSTTYCCDKFARDAENLQASAGGGVNSGERPRGQFERQEDDTWAINGCCGGGCYVVTEMVFCPYCGTSLIETIDPAIAGETP
jgi:hypothetical protein